MPSFDRIEFLLTCIHYEYWGREIREKLIGTKVKSNLKCKDNCDIASVTSDETFTSRIEVALNGYHGF